MAPELWDSGSHAPLPSEQEGATMSSVSIPNFFTLAHESSGVPASDCHPQRGGFGPRRVLAGMVIRFIWG